VVRERIVSALDRLLPQQKKDGVRALLRRVDADLFRDAVRDVVLAEDAAKLAELAGQPAALEQPAGFVAFLGECGAITVERRRELLQAALSRRPGDLGLLMTLGRTYPVNQRDGVNERVRWYQAAVATAPANAAAHNDLGNALQVKGQLDEAIACYHKALDLDPKLAPAHNNLGNALQGKGQVDEAIACFHQAIALDPKLALARNNLGLALRDKGQVDEAIACYRQALVLDPKDAGAHTNLGNALQGKGQVDAAIACYQKAVVLDPKLANAHYNLGLAQSGKGQVDAAIACYRQAIAVDPKLAIAHCNLGLALGGQGQFAESLDALRRGHELGTKQPGWPSSSAQWVRQAEGLATLEARLPAFLKGEHKPRDTAERLGLAFVCHAKKLHHAASLLYADAFAADPKLADFLPGQHRYFAAGSAALAAAGQSEDAGKLDDRERARLRQQAFDWLRADLVLWTKQLELGKSADRAAVQQALRYWQQDADLAGLRHATALAKLPAEEQKAFAQLWADVATLLKKAETAAPKETKP
jgi:tetratricopeptide (TPR) repeat protein